MQKRILLEIHENYALFFSIRFRKIMLSLAHRIKHQIGVAKSFSNKFKKKNF